MSAIEQSSDFLQFVARPRATAFLGTGRVKGTILAAHVQWVKENRSADEYVRFWDVLPRETRTAIGMVLPVKWYEFAHLVAMDHAIVDLFGNGSIGILREVGRHSARFNLGGAYKAYTRPSIHEFFASAARLHAQYQDFGTVSYSQRNGTSGIMTHSLYTSY